jgi:hypothetical protein
MIDMRRSTVNRPRSALRMREKSAAAIPVRLCAADAQALPVERLDDPRGQDGLELIRIRILVSEVAKNISASPHYFQLFAFHRNISFSLCKRSFTRSISRLGVLMPCVDFF